MKRIFLMIALGFVIECVHAQQYYNMWRGVGESGKPEWIANLAMATYDNYTGINFTTANSSRGFVNGYGRWGFRKPGTHLDVLSFNNIINGINNLTVGVEGWICPEGLSIRKLWDGVTTTLDLFSVDGKSSITSNGDAAHGLHIKSAIGKKIYMYDKIYFNDKSWSTIGSGRHDDTTINNPNSKMLRIGSNAGIGFWGNGLVGTDDSPNMWLTAAGELRIGTIATLYKLNVAGGICSENQGIRTILGTDSDHDDTWFGTTTNHGLYLGTNSKSALYVDKGENNVYIGLIDTDVALIRPELKSKYKLFVKKGVLSEDYSIAPKASWADFVFDENYELKNAHELESFILENKHLPDVPSAKQIAEEGYNQHDMNKILLQKIEELTLYTIQQQKKIAVLEAEIDRMKSGK